jgi:RimJ/RimL family protein N-acetyltransferase
MDYLIAPERFDGDGFILRSYEVTDGPLLSEAVNESYEHLRTWMPWAKPQQTLDESERLVRQFRGRYLLAEDFVLGIFSQDQTRLLGGTGFHLREGPLSTCSAEIGMFIRSSDSGKGLGTRVLSTLLEWGFSDWPWLRLAWRCDQRNAASVRVAEKVGLRLEGVHRAQPAEVGAGRRNTACFALAKSDWLDSRS